MNLASYECLVFIEREAICTENIKSLFEAISAQYFMRSNLSNLLYNMLHFQLEKGRKNNQNKIIKIIPMES